jgi:hypothetical protein
MFRIKASAPPLVAQPIGTVNGALAVGNGARLEWRRSRGPPASPRRSPEAACRWWSRGRTRIAGLTAVDGIVDQNVQNGEVGGSAGVGEGECECLRRSGAGDGLGTPTVRTD